MRRRRFDDVFDVLRRQMQSMFDEFGEDMSGDMLPSAGGLGSSLPSEGGFRTPVADFWETDNEVVATLELPGVDKKDIEINTDKGSLEIKVEKKKEEKDKKHGRYMSNYTGFYRRLPLSDNVEPDKTKATYNNGILEVRIPKKDEAKKEKKRISVE